MKKIYSIIILASIVLLNTSCEENMKDELFVKKVLLTKNGWQDVELVLSEDNFTQTNVPISVNGTSENGTNITVTLAADPDTLDAYNLDKWKNQTHLYYPELTSEAYSFEKNSFTIKAGEVYTVANMIIDINKIENMYEEYVIPLKIASVSELGIASSGYAKSLMHIVWKNKYSGIFSGEIVVHDKDDSANKVTVNSKTFYAIGPNKCYLYAGHKDRSSLNREDYIINVDFKTEGANSTATLSAKNPAIELNVERSDISLSYKKNTSDPRYVIETSLIEFVYTFKDMSTAGSPILKSSGKVTKVDNKVPADSIDPDLIDEEED